jgi:glycosyltransferase involved in cell wall biosynthesis
MLIIVGGGREQSKLERQAEEASIRASVRFVGETHPSRVDAFYEEADLFVKPSWSEGVSNAVLEAIVHRVPVVASRIPGNVDVIQHEESGLLFDPGSAMALAEAIVDSLTNRATARLRAERAYQRVAEEFDIRQVAKEYLKLYEALLEQHARGKPATASRG